MSDYADFRLVLSELPDASGRWDVRIADSPVAAQRGKGGNVTPAFTSAQLTRLRSQNDWPNTGDLRAIGAAVWESVMAPVAAQFDAVLEVVREKGRRLRIVLVLRAQDGPSSNGVPKLADVPLESLFSPAHNFLGSDVETPISRWVQESPDRPPIKVDPPLRVLVVAATPSDMPEAKADEEFSAIEKAVVKAGKLVALSRCMPPTLAELRRRLDASRADRPHVLHFAGHGKFDILGNDPTEQPHLCFENDAGKTHAVGVDDLVFQLRNSGVQLVVMTACQSAAASPVGPPRPPRQGQSAFDGIAKALVTMPSGVTAAVGMQFDLEDTAVAEFSGDLYERLVKPDCALDEAVTQARIAISTKLTAGHRAWVNPTLYWRCQGARVFELAARVMKPEDSVRLDAQRQIVASLEGSLMQSLADPPPLQVVAKRFIHLARQRQLEQAEILGDALRLEGAFSDDVEASVTLHLHLSSPAIAADLVRVDIDMEGAGGVAVSAVAPLEVASGSLTSAFAAGSPTKLVLVQPSGGASWPAGTRALARITFCRADVKAAALLRLKLRAGTLTLPTGPRALDLVDAFVFFASRP
jgi:hypothetical protein